MEFRVDDVAFFHFIKDQLQVLENLGEEFQDAGQLTLAMFCAMNDADAEYFIKHLKNLYLEASIVSQR